MDRTDNLTAWLHGHIEGCDVDQVVADGRMHRFGKKKNQWYIAREVIGKDGEIVTFLYAGCWVSGEKYEVYQAADKVHATQIKEGTKILKEQLQADMARLQAEAAQEAQKIHTECPPLTTKTAYLSRKRVELQPHDDQLRYDVLGDVIYVPMHVFGHDNKPELVGYQRILPDGTKLYLSGQRTKGAFYILDTDTEANVTLFCEGFATALTLRQATGYAVVVCFTCHGLKQVVKSFQHLWPGEQYLICADDDWQTFKPVANPGRSAAQDCFVELGVPHVVPVFTGQRGPKDTDFNDLYIKEGLNVVRDQIEAALNQWALKVAPPALAPKDEPPKQELKKKPLPASGKLDANQLALNLLENMTIVTDVDGSSYAYNGVTWEFISEQVIQHLIYSLDTFSDTRRSRRMEAMSCVKAMTTVKKRIKWQHNLGFFEVPFENGVYNIQTGQLRDHRDKDYLLTVIPHKYDPEAFNSLWLECLVTWLDDSPDKAQALQQFFGYMLMSQACYKKALVLYGPSDSGKTVITNVIHHLVGLENICHISVGVMDDDRKLQPIKYKMVNIIEELPYNSLIADAGFKRLVSTNQAITIDPKYKDPEQYLPSCKHVISTNVLPMINDKTEACYNRLLLIYFANVIAKTDQDTELTAKLCNDIPGIINWALDGARDLIQNKGRFPVLEESKQILDEHKREQNPIAYWVDQHLVAQDGCTETVETLYQNFMQTHRGKMSFIQFARLLGQLGYETERTRTLLGPRRRCLKGFRYVA